MTDYKPTSKVDHEIIKWGNDWTYRNLYKIPPLPKIDPEDEGWDKRIMDLIKQVQTTEISPKKTPDTINKGTIKSSDEISDALAEEINQL